jgi:hypothetical protein
LRNDNQTRRTTTAPGVTGNGTRRIADGVGYHATNRIIGACNSTRSDTEKTQILRLPEGERVAQQQTDSQDGKKYAHFTPLIQNIYYVFTLSIPAKYMFYNAINNITTPFTGRSVNNSGD